MNSRFRKELRDALRWLPIGAILVTVLIWYVLLRSPNFYERLSSELFFVVWISSAVFGFFLSLITFLPDDREAARAFLVHRGVPINSIYWTRILVGLLIYFSVMFAPLGFASLYLASIGPDYAPVSAIQVIPACFAVVYCTAFYFAGIIVACRPSHWLGTRILPIAAAIATALASTGLLISELMYTPIPLFLGAIGLFVLYVASRHTFTQLPPRIAPVAGVIRSRSLQLTLLVSSVLAVSTLCMLPINWVDNTPHEHQLIEFSKDGEPWLTTRPYRYQQSNKVSKRIRMTNDSPDANAASVPATAFEASAGTMLQDPNWNRHPWDAQPVSMGSDTYCFYDNSGFLRTS